MSGENKITGGGGGDTTLHVRLMTSCYEPPGYHYIDGGPRTPTAQSSLQLLRPNALPYCEGSWKATRRMCAAIPPPQLTLASCMVWGYSRHLSSSTRTTCTSLNQQVAATSLSLYAQVCLFSTWFLPFTSTLGTFVWLAQKALYSLNRSA